MKRSVFAFLCLVICSLYVAGCAPASTQTNNHVTVAHLHPPKTDKAPADIAPSPAIVPLPEPEALPPYRLQIGDRLKLRLVLNPELDEEVIIRPDGMISTALVQNVMAYGRTPLELQKELARFYKSQLKKPKISVIVQSFAPTRVYVLGEVSNPGEFVSVESNPTVLQAVARAGGILESASVDTFLILRRIPGQQEKVYSINYKDAVTGRDLAQDIRLAAQDILIVPRSGIGNVYHYYRQYIQKFLPPSFGLGYNLNPDDG